MTTERFQGCSAGVLFRLAYGWNEATYHACEIADVVEAAGVPVTFSSLVNRERGVHEYWDERISSASGSLSTVSKHLRTSKISDVIWFDVRREEAKLTRKAGLRNTLVLTNASWTDSLLASVHLFDNVVVLSQSLQQRISQYVKSTYIPPMCNPCSINTNPVDHRDSLLWLMDTATFRKYGAGVAIAADVILRDHPNYRLSIMCYGSWGGLSNKHIDRLSLQHVNRFTAARKVSHGFRRNHYQRHGSVVSLSHCDATGLRLLESLAACRPIAAFDYGAPGEIIADCSERIWKLPSVPLRPEGFEPIETTIQFELLLDSLIDFYAGVRAGQLIDSDAKIGAYLNARFRLFQNSWQRLLKLG
jgi:hypothetical protein